MNSINDLIGTPKFSVSSFICDNQLLRRSLTKWITFTPRWISSNRFDNENTDIIFMAAKSRLLHFSSNLLILWCFIRCVCMNKRHSAFVVFSRDVLNPDFRKTSSFIFLKSQFISCCKYSVVLYRSASVPNCNQKGQQCIPVGCVPPALVAVLGMWGVHPLSTPTLSTLPAQVPAGMHPLVDRMTDRPV